MNLRLKGGHCERQQLTFRFIFPVLHVVLNKRCQRQTGVSQFISVVQSFVARCCKMQCVRDAKQSESHYVTMPITDVMAV